MVTKLDKTHKVTGQSGKEYSFDLYLFDDFDDLKGYFNGKGLYLFTKRENAAHTRIYLGKTTDYSTRYNNHHKEQCIKRKGSNCIGLHRMNNASQETIDEAEIDILEGNYFPCNDQNN